MLTPHVQRVGRVRAGLPLSMSGSPGTTGGPGRSGPASPAYPALMSESPLVRPEPVSDGAVRCPRCAAVYPAGPTACPICAGLGAPATGSSGPGEDRVLGVDLQS